MELSTTSIESAPDEHTYEPGQESDFGRTLIRAGIPCRVYRDEAGELVHEFDCKAPRRSGANVRLDPTMRPPQPVIRPIGHAPRAATNTRTRGSRRGSRASSSSSDDPGGEADPPSRGRRLDGRREVDEWLAERKAALDALILAEGLGRRQLRFDESEAA